MARARRSGRVAEGGALLRRYGDEYLHRGFESLLLRLADVKGPRMAGLSAVRAGFEPATHLSARTRFPVALLRPLGHLTLQKRRGRDLNPRRTKPPETVFETAAFDRSATPPRPTGQSSRAQLTVIFSSIPSCLWPGTAQKNSYVPFFSVAVSVV